jgi:hypothetical protein
LDFPVNHPILSGKFDGNSGADPSCIKPVSARAALQF